tara:strand:+ start:486 stop:1469 length:984 start_codon:yes stop_codon:yes gene_type:complete
MIGNFEGVQHSRCVQRRVGAPTDAAGAFNESGHQDICLVVVPRSPALCCQFVSIPSGFFVLYQRWYANEGQLEPGFKACWPFWFRVSHVVNAATITYSAPSRQVPTADNVMVDINLSLTFNIGPSYEDAQLFVYLLGCTRFDEFLAAEVEEGIRGLVYSVTHDRVNDLREEFAQNMLASLSAKFRPFGVQIKNVKVTETRLPRILAESLEQTTTFRTRISEVAKKHENTIRVLQDEASQELEQVCLRPRPILRLLSPARLKWRAALPPPIPTHSVPPHVPPCRAPSPLTHLHSPPNSPPTPSPCLAGAAHQLSPQAGPARPVHAVRD